MTQHYPVVVERESNGTFSAWVAGLPGVYAAVETAAMAKRAIRSALTVHLQALSDLGREPRPQGEVVVLRYDELARTRRARLRFVGLGALMNAPRPPRRRRRHAGTVARVDVPAKPWPSGARSTCPIPCPPSRV